VLYLLRACVEHLTRAAVLVRAEGHLVLPSLLFEQEIVRPCLLPYLLLCLSAMLFLCLFGFFRLSCQHDLAHRTHLKVPVDVFLQQSHLSLCPCSDQVH
jgi:hypothetical protein